MFLRERPIVSQAEVHYRAAKYCDAIRDKQRQMDLMDEQAHQGEVSQHGNQAVGEMEPHELAESRGVVAAVAPRVVQMPHEVVHERELDGRG